MMIPLTYLLALPLIALAIWLMVRHFALRSAPVMIAFLAVLSLQLILIGTRYGYGVDDIVLIQPLSGILIPPLAYLAFTERAMALNVAILLPSLVTMLAIVHFTPYFIDPTLALATFVFALALAAKGFRGQIEAPWAPLRYAGAFQAGLWMTVAFLILSGTTDTIIAVDFITTGGTQTTQIAGFAAIVAAISLPLALWYWWTAPRGKTGAGDEVRDRALLEDLNHLLIGDHLFRDPDLSLGKLARRLRVPARQLSEAVNRTAGQNLSQYINEKRIQAACTMLTTTDDSITGVMLDAGFYTKSNFNREFRRVTGKSPTEWRTNARRGLAEETE